MDAFTIELHKYRLREWYFLTIFDYRMPIFDLEHLTVLASHVIIYFGKYQNDLRLCQVITFSQMIGSRDVFEITAESRKEIHSHVDMPNRNDGNAEQNCHQRS